MCSKPYLVWCYLAQGIVIFAIVDLRDFIVTPIVIMGVYALAYYLRPRLCDENNYRYFFPGLTVKILGALALGFIYQFYYDGGDTYNYHTFGSRIIWDAFFEDPSAAIKMIVNPTLDPHLYKYISHIRFYNDPSSMVIVRIAALFDFITFSSYCGTAVLFAFFSFLGLWFFFLTFYSLFPHLERRVAVSILFIPSVVFWGSGILKDTVVIAALGVLVYFVKQTFIDKRPSLAGIFNILFTGFLIFSIKKYILLCFLPAVLLWIYISNLRQIRSQMVRVLIAPAIVAIAIVSGYYSVIKIGEDDPRYALDKIAQTSRVTAYDIAFQTGRDAGSTYVLGELDDSFRGMVTLFPQAVNVSLFRPYLWEVNNPLMALSAVEAFVLFIITLLLVLRYPLRSIRSLSNPTILFCLVFSITFAFAVGVSTFNFGTLTRYRIPLLPFYLLALVLIADSPKSPKKVEELESTE